MEKKTLNAGQAKAADGLFKFLMDPERKCIILTGGGGVGKSFLIGHMVDTLLPQYQQMCEMMGRKAEYNEVALTATTNKAAEALGEASGMQVDTIHSFLKLRVREDFASGKMTLTRNRDWTVQRDMIVVIDEASMIDKALRPYINEGLHNCKIIFVCDAKQLAPVGEKLSVIFSEGHEVLELTEPMRTSDPHLQALNQQFRDVVATDGAVWTPVQMVPGTINWMSEEQAMSEISQSFATPTGRDRVLGWSTGFVNDMNDFLRTNVRGMGREFVPGEQLVNNSAFSYQKATVSTEAPIEVIAVDDRVQTMSLPHGASIEYREMDLMTPHLGLLHAVPVPTDRNHFRDLVKWYAANKQWPTYFKLKETFPDLRPRDASTTHKAQGSSYDRVFINLTDLCKCTHADVSARLFYVAVSRARHQVNFFGQMAARYTQIIL